MILRVMKTIVVNNTRTFKNFGHKRRPEPLVTVLWQGFLTLTFIGLGIEWKKVAQIFLGDDHGIEQGPMDVTIPGPEHKASSTTSTENSANIEKPNS